MASVLLHQSFTIKFGYCRPPVTYVSLRAENKSNSITCKFAYILDVVFFMFHKMQNKQLQAKTNITCVFMAFGDVSERFLRVLTSLYSSSKLHMERVRIGPILSMQSWSIRHYTTEKLRKNATITRSRKTSQTSNAQF